MDIRNEIKSITELGRIPDESDDSLSEELIDSYSDALEKIKKPVNYQEAKALVQIFPESGLYGIEWELLHLVESSLTQVSIEEYKEVILLCPSDEWRSNMLIRFENWQKKHTI